MPRRLSGVLSRRVLPLLNFCLLAATASFGQSPTAPVPPPAAPTAAGAAIEAPPGVENSVVKIFSTIRLPDSFKPWTKQSPSEASGTGVIIEGHRILTNAHVVTYASQVQVQANQSGDKISATVEYIAPGIDLALLKLDDDSFFDSRKPLARANTLPAIKDNVLAYGYPTGGTGLAITKGIVSRIEFAGYNFPTSGLRIQIDAAINPGNSGGPALSGDQMIGLAFSRLGGGDNIGYIIPCEEIELFLADIADGKYDGKPAMYAELQSFENPALRSFLKLGKEVEGIVVTEPQGGAGDPLRHWDVISRIGDVPVDNEGMIKLNASLRVRFQYLIQKLAKGGKVPLTVVRDGKSIDVQLPVSAEYPMLMPDLAGEYPPYFVYGPMAFSIATSVYFGPIANSARGMAALTFVGNPMATRRGEQPAFPGEELVIIPSPFFPHKSSKGYDNPMSKVVESINGVRIRNLHHLVEVLRDSKAEFLEFRFAGRGSESYVFKRAELEAATEDILSDNGVRNQGSPDVLEVWKKRP